MNKDFFKSVVTLSAGFSLVLSVMVIAVLLIALGLSVAVALFPFVVIVVLVLYFLFREKTIKAANDLGDAMGFEEKN